MPNQHPKKMKTKDDLLLGITAIIPGQPERIPWVWYDSQPFVSNTTTSVDLHVTVQNDKTLGNMEAAGQIPSPQYQDIFHIAVYYWLPPSSVVTTAAASNAGTAADVEQLLRGIAVLNIAQKVYWRSPQWMCPSGGGVFSQLAQTGTFTAPAGLLTQVATNGWPTLQNRNNFFGDITIPHNQNFDVLLSWSAPFVTNTASVRTFSLVDGYLYRRVL